jgi:CRISPR system Cascade subunit CasE
MTLKLLRLEPDAAALAHWATRNRVLSPDGDYGYALHALFAAAFGAMAPKPFRYLGGRQGLLAYTAAPLDDLRLSASLATPDVARALGVEMLDARPFPADWKEGQSLGFEVRVRPVVRTKDGRERDAYLHAVEGRAQTELSAEQDAPADRPMVYGDWLARQLGEGGAAELVDAKMDSFSLTRVLRRTGVGENGRRRSTQTAGPDVVFKGTLRIGKPEAFNRLLARGLGRHRAFGFGMLLLRPAASC